MFTELPNWPCEVERSERLDFVSGNTLHRTSRNGKLFRQNEPMKGFYLVHDGCFKETHVDEDGYETITGFYQPGQFVGLSSVGEETYDNTAEAVIASATCLIHYPLQKATVSQIGPALLHKVLCIMANELEKTKYNAYTKKIYRSDQKLADFVLKQSDRPGQPPARHFSLPMSRQDIASYLGISPETLSRLFGRFEAQGLVSTTKKKHVEILDQEGLLQLLQKR